jgi:pseudaminic acid cytidylyltransferase
MTAGTGRLAVIPARGGSKRIPRKNIKPFAGKPMLSYAIDAARASGLFDHIVVSTDDEEIAQLARSAGATVPFMRPPELSDDITPTVPVVAHAIRECAARGMAADQVCCIYPGVPLLDVADLKQAFDLLQSSGSAYVFPVTTFPSAVQRALQRDADGSTRPMYPQFASTRTQDLEPAYHDVGQFYWGTARSWLDGLNIHQNGRTIVVPEWRVVDIDTPADWQRAEALFHALGGTRA